MDRMKNWWDQILWKFSNCPYCGSLFRDSHFLFCSSCFQSLWNRRNQFPGFLVPASAGLPSFPVRSLFLWIQDEDVPLSLLLKLMKQGAHPESARPLMLGFAGELLRRGALGKAEPGCILVPAPARQGNIQDHAWVLATQLTLMMPGSHIRTDLLERKPEESERVEKKGNSFMKSISKLTLEQKQKSRAAREKRRFRLTKQGQVFLKLNPDCHIYFVDDILTTGATAKAAWVALKKPSHFEALVLAYRKQPSLFDILRSHGKSVTTVPNFK